MHNYMLIYVANNFLNWSSIEQEGFIRQSQHKTMGQVFPVNVRPLKVLVLPLTARLRLLL